MLIIPYPPQMSRGKNAELFSACPKAPEREIGVYRTKIEHVIANQRARWCGNPPDLPVSQNRPGSSINAEKKRELFYYSILKIRGIGQCAHWLAMTCFCLGSQ